MAGNSVPVFFGAKARTKKPPGIDVTSITDLSGSMQPFASFIASATTITALENALIAEGIGILSPNRYSFTRGGGSNLREIERNVIVNGVSTRWAPGADVLNGTVTVPTLVANLGNAVEDMGLATNIVSATDRDYLSVNERIIISGSDEQTPATAFSSSPLFSYRYVGVHSVLLSISEPAGPNPVPAGTLVGFVYTTNTTGVAVYINGNTINNRADVPVANVTATASDSSVYPGLLTKQINVDQARLTNGAIYNINFFTGGFQLLAQSLGSALGRFLFETS
jgi:hypothetical protein